MTERMIEQSMDSDLRGIESALLRAAQRARERARMTGTRLVVSEDGVLKFVPPDRLEPVSQEVADQFERYDVEE
ncbi:hypothetical protein [Wenzhouxiangella sp. EGI_FJ10409]|uniref:hypothetical protein n=1 Tax=Wenzhouxiangella sp. EGI_FJ10409 TaxID=3243767 RepID=UPI0035DA3168